MYVTETTVIHAGASYLHSELLRFTGLNLKNTELVLPNMAYFLYRFLKIIKLFEISDRVNHR